MGMCYSYHTTGHALGVFESLSFIRKGLLHKETAEPPEPWSQCLSPPQDWLCRNVETLRSIGKKFRAQMKIADGTVGPLPPVLKEWEFVYFCLGRSVSDIEKLRGGKILRLEEWDQHHYPTGR